MALSHLALDTLGFGGQLAWGGISFGRQITNNRGQDTALALNDWATSNNGLNYTQFIQQYNYSGSVGNNGNLVSSAESFSPGAAVPYASLPAFLNQTYSYDGVNRLVSVSDPSYSRTFCYDAYGNGWVNSYTGQFSGDTPNENGLSCSAATPYKANNQISSVVTAGGYDAAGNQTIVKGNTLTYDAENRLISVMSGSAPVATYQYDGDGHRIAKTASGVTTNYIYDAFGRLAAEYVNGVLSKDYIRMMSGYIPGGSDLVAIENGPGNAGSPCGTCFVMVDDLGSVRVMTDTGGDIISRHDYLPFGEEVLAGGGRPGGYGFGVVDGASERFTGKERDSESGLDNFGARYFGSSLGRWSSPDLVNVTRARLLNPSSTLNKYVYAADNPLTLVDPDGRDVTYFYDQGGIAGHAVLFAYNPKTGDSAIESFGPKVHSPVWAGESMFEMDVFKSEEQLRGTFASLTIPTTPELAQQVIDYIRSHPDPALWSFTGPDCSSVVWHILKESKLGGETDLITYPGLLPRLLWNQLILTYNPAYLHEKPEPGSEYGKYQYSSNSTLAFDLLWQSLSKSNENIRPQKEVVTSTFCTADGCQ